VPPRQNTWSAFLAATTEEPKNDFYDCEGFADANLAFARFIPGICTKMYPADPTWCSQSPGEPALRVRDAAGGVVVPPQKFGTVLVLLFPVAAGRGGLRGEAEFLSFEVCPIGETGPSFPETSGYFGPHNRLGETNWTSGISNEAGPGSLTAIKEGLGSGDGAATMDLHGIWNAD